jgi:hypothetical protein
MKSDLRAEAKSSSPTADSRGCRPSRGNLAALALAVISLSLALLAPAAQAKEVIAYFGSAAGQGRLGGEFWFPGDIAVNSSAAGPANKGDIYVTDRGGGGASSRVQRFAQNDNGTPAEPYDDKYEFISAWGANVDSTPSGGSDYEICTVAAECQGGLQVAGNGSAAGNGDFNSPRAIAVDQDTGDLYVSDQINRRVSVYEGDGTFLRSFGYDVVESGPDNAGTGYEVCVAANGDICKAGLFGAGTGQVGAGEAIAVSAADGSPATGTVFLADHDNHRIDTYDLDGSSPSSFGSEANFGAFGPSQVAVDSRGIVYADKVAFGESGIARYDSQNANGGGVGFLAPISAPPLSTANTATTGIEVDPDPDGAGPETDVLYVLRSSGAEPLDSPVQQFGPLNKPGLTAPPSAVDAEHGLIAGFGASSALGLDESSGRLFVSDQQEVAAAPPVKSGVYVLDTAGSVPTATLESLSDVTSTTVTAHGAVNPNGPPDVSYRLEYSTDGSKWTAGPSTLLGRQESPQPVELVLNPPPDGLESNTFYHVRLAAIKPFTPAVVTAEKTFTTLAEAPLVETSGAPVRTATTAQLNGRIDPRNSASTYRFEYGTEGPCDANPCAATEPQPAGSGNLTELASEEIEGLEPNTVYHYRIIGESAAPGSPSHGADMTVTTRASDAPLSHGHFPGPPGSDRAYEQVSIPNSGGNPVFFGYGFAEDGNRALYQVTGGTPVSATGSFINLYLSERTPTGWRSSFLSPPREELIGSSLTAISTPADLSSVGARNQNFAVISLWRLRPDTPAVKLYETSPLQDVYEATGQNGYMAIATESPRTIVPLTGGELDPAFPEAGTKGNLYDVSSAAPKLVSLLPDGKPAPCGIQTAPNSANNVANSTHPLADDGSHAFFSSTGSSCNSSEELYMRDFETEQTKLVSGPPLSGPACGAVLLRADDDVAYFSTSTRLDPADTVSSGCGGADVYRYDIGTEGLKCLTCVIPGGVDALNGQNGPRATTAVARDGSRVYFHSTRALLPGAPASDEGSLYVVEVGTDELRWVAGPGVQFGETSAGAAISHDGSSIRFLAKAPSLNPLGGTSDNGGTMQYYRYDDRDRSLLCASCPTDGSAPPTAAIVSEGGDNTLSDDGALIFATTNALVGADQNTPAPGKEPGAGTDVYEWRDGRPMLVTDGLTSWPSTGSGGDFEAPKAQHIDRSGRDAFFIAAAQYTPDALDGYARMYDARIGGGINFPKPPPPCPLEVCQGTPKGAPEEQAPGTGTFAGTGNAHPLVRHHKKRHHKKPQKQRQHRANHNRRAHR